MKGQSLILLTLLMSTTGLQAEESNNKERGRYWYQEPEQAEETEPEKPAQEEESFTRPSLPPFEKLMTMHPRQIEKLYTEVHEYHVMKPTESTALDLLILNNVLTKKSRAAAAVSQITALKNPQLTGTFENPIAPSIKNINNQQQSLIVAERLIEKRNEYALVVATQPGCGACNVFKNTLSLFRDKYRWNIKEVDITKNPEFAHRFNITGTPTTILVGKNSSQWMPIAQGAEPFTTVVKNASQGIRLLSGEIKPEQWFTSDVQTDSYFDPGYTPLLNEDAK